MDVSPKTNAISRWMLLSLSMGLLLCIGAASWMLTAKQPITDPDVAKRVDEAIEVAYAHTDCERESVKIEIGKVRYDGAVELRVVGLPATPGGVRYMTILNGDVIEDLPGK
ncbi:MAG: hypothetical protein AB8G99_01475 [Planctomycetaceae bacterium]